jgi:hypothetical protein
MMMMFDATALNCPEPVKVAIKVCDEVLMFDVVVG